MVADTAAILMFFRERNRRSRKTTDYTIADQNVILFVIFIVLKLFFFPNFIKQHAEKGNEADFVATELSERAP